MTPEQKQRIEQIEKRTASRYLGVSKAVVVADNDFLLSLVKSQEAQLSEWESHRDGIIELVNTAENAATSMRNACVNAVKAKQEQWRTEAAKFLQIPSSHSIKERVLAADDIITALESVSIQEQEK